MKLKDITSEQWEFIIDRAEKTPQGVHVWYKGVPFPRRVYYNPINDTNYILRALHALGVVKKFLFSLSYLSGLVIPRTLNIKKYETFLIRLDQLCRWQLDEFLLKDDEWSVPVWEIGKFIERFLLGLGINSNLAKQWARTGMAILEYDNAYRYRVQDVIGETTKEQLRHPRKEIKRLLSIYLDREMLFKDNMEFGARGKITKLVRLLSYAVLIPKIKNALLQALEDVDLEKIRMDKNDWFHVSFWHGYDYGGKTFEERFSPYEEIYKTVPFRKREDPSVTVNFMTGA